MRCAFDVSGMILLQAVYLYTHSLLNGVTFEVPPPLQQLCTMLPATVGNISGTPVVEQLSVPSSHFLDGCLPYPDIFVPLRQTLFL